MRPSGRNYDQIRDVSIEIDYIAHAEGSCLIRFGNTHVICTASIDDSIPPFLKGKGKGWLTAEYGMLPRATHTRSKREAVSGKQTGRTMEIQRLISRSLRSITDLEDFGEKQIIIDCDVIQADGGTRTASITGAYVALYLACSRLSKRRIIHKIPFYTEMAAISCGIVNGKAMVDLDYEEDSQADVDANFVMSSSGSLIEVQGTAEKNLFSPEQFIEMMNLASGAIRQLTEIQRAALKLL